EAAPSRKLNDVVAIIAPHAGYVYSGATAASSYNQIDASRSYENIFILGPSHYVGFEGASVYTAGDFVTPLGTVRVNRELGEQLIRQSSLFSNRADAHRMEHSVEVQVPFLQYILKRPFQIVPIVIGAGDPATCAELGRLLKPFLNSKNLFVISTDFSHYPSYADAKSIDKATSDAVLANSISALTSTIGSNEKRGVANLVTSMCGWSCVLTLLSMTQDNPDITYTAIQYRNSGDSEFGDKSKVVGYCSIVASLKQHARRTEFRLTAHEEQSLLSLARMALERHFGLTHRDIDTTALSGNLKQPCGAFVTLNENNRLRGCIGRFEPGEPLYKVVVDMAVASATQDYRFSAVRPEELKSIEIEISVLTPLRKIESVDEIQMGKHGIYIRKGDRAGTFLPQVATETGWTKEEFLGHCAQDKAGIGWNGWKDADLFVYEALVFGEHAHEP
ncbi:MAG TPA: AmmeMemoRadiSam system protein B, partial [Bacteroidota bacterium]|nr:AmmeMemoRadiSam system protein B [Bacteroidota bacterium]